LVIKFNIVNSESKNIIAVLLILNLIPLFKHHFCIVYIILLNILNTAVHLQIIRRQEIEGILNGTADIINANIKKSRVLE
jgi:hypothetical protein